MAFQRRGTDGSDPIEHLHEERRVLRSGHLGIGTLACPHCDAPVILPAGRASPADPLACPFCHHSAAVRDFLSLAAPSRPARVVVQVIPAARRAVAG